VASLTLLLAAACGGQDSGASTRASPGNNPAAASTTPDPKTPPAPTSGASNDIGASMDIELVLDDTTLHGALDDTAAGRDFASLLPLTFTVTDFHATEKISDLPRRLSTEDTPSGTAGSAGDITYYAPWGNLALFYRDSDYADGLVRLGRLDPEAADVLAGLDDGTTVTIDAAGQ
jgi:hypothetical protein